MRTLIIGLALALAMLIGIAVAGEEGLPWVSFDDALETAADEGKPFMVDFYTDWCHWCKVMDSKTFSNEAVAPLLTEEFLISRVHAEDGNAEVHYRGKKYSNVEFTRAMNITGFPSVAFFDSDANPITVIPGYIEADTFKYILSYVREGCYKQKMSFQEFMKRKGECDETK